jgi:hypothetical protein
MQKVQGVFGYAGIAQLGMLAISYKREGIQFPTAIA